MSDDTPAATYGSYLKIDELLSLQQPRSDGPEHDEMLFIIIHQVYELWFKELLHEFDHVMQLLEADESHRSQHTLKRILTILKVMVAQLDILETMTPLEFLSFRERLDAASGFQSDQFRQIEFLLGVKSEQAIRRFPDGSRARAALERRYREATLWDAFLRYLSRAIRRAAVASRSRGDGAGRTLARDPADSHRGVSPRPEERGVLRAPGRSGRGRPGMALSSREDGRADDRRQARNGRIGGRRVSATRRSAAPSFPTCGRSGRSCYGSGAGAGGCDEDWWARCSLLVATGAFSLNRWILPVCVLGSALTNLTERGYL